MHASYEEKLNDMIVSKDRIVGELECEKQYLMTQVYKLEKNIACLESKSVNGFVGPRRSFYDHNYASTTLFRPTYVCTYCMRDDISLHISVLKIGFIIRVVQH